MVFQTLLPMEPPTLQSPSIAPAQSPSVTQVQSLTALEPFSSQPQPSVAPQPCLINTQFGHVVRGSLPPQHKSKVCNKVSLKYTSCDSDLSESIARFWSAESVPETFSEKGSEQELCEYIFKNTVQLKDNQFKVALPLKLPLNEINDALGDSFHFALKRFLNLEKKLHQNPELFSEYQKFINEYLSLNHGHFVDIELYELNNDAVYFLPHHAVIKQTIKQQNCALYLMAL